MLLSSSVYSNTSLDSERISQADLNIENKSRSNLLPWKGQFSPQLIQVLLNHFADSNSVIFDPFLGSGTVLYEAGLANLQASGTEINPAAVSLAQIYHFINIPVKNRREYIREIGQLLQSSFPLSMPLFNIGKADASSEELKFELVNITNCVSDRFEIQLLETLITLLDFYKPDFSTDKIHKVWHNLKQTIINLPFSSKKISVFHADARQSPLANSSVDLVITSPPYINVFNYHQQYRTSMEALSWDLLRVAKSEIGSNRKHRSNRFLTVIQYCLDMAQTFQELERVCRQTAPIIFVVGRESRVRGTPFGNGEIVAEVATKALGFSLTLKQERVFQNRFGNDIYEDILHFTKPLNNRNDLNPLMISRQIAQEVLEAAFRIAPENAKDDIQSAIQRISVVHPSPIFDLAGILE